MGKFKVCLAAVGFVGLHGLLVERGDKLGAQVAQALEVVARLVPDRKSECPGGVLVCHLRSVDLQDIVCVARDFRVVRIVEHEHRDYVQTHAVALLPVVDERRRVENLETLYHGLEAEAVVGLDSVLERSVFGIVLRAEVVVRAQLRPERAAGVFQNKFVGVDFVEHFADCRGGFVVAAREVVVHEHLRREHMPQALVELALFVTRLIARLALRPLHVRPQQRICRSLELVARRAVRTFEVVGGAVVDSVAGVFEFVLEILARQPECEVLFHAAFAHVYQKPFRVERNPVEEEFGKLCVGGNIFGLQDVDLSDVAHIAQSCDGIGIARLLVGIDVERLDSRAARHRQRKPVDARIERKALDSVVYGLEEVDVFFRRDCVERRLLPFVGDPPCDARFLAVVADFVRDGVGVVFEGDERGEDVSALAFGVVCLGGRALVYDSDVVARIEFFCGLVGEVCARLVEFRADFVARNEPGNGVVNRASYVVFALFGLPDFVGLQARVAEPNTDPVPVFGNGVVCGDVLDFFAVDLHRVFPPFVFLVLLELVEGGRESPECATLPEKPRIWRLGEP